MTSRRSIRYRNEHLERTERLLELHCGPAMDLDDIQSKLAYYDALLCRPPLERVLPTDSYRAFDAFWMAGEHDKAYDYVIGFPVDVTKIDPEQVAFATSLWNTLDARRWKAAAALDSADVRGLRERIAQGFFEGKPHEPWTWYDSIEYGSRRNGSSGPPQSWMRIFQGGNVGQSALTNMTTAGQLTYEGRALLTTIRATFYPKLTDSVRLQLMDATCQIEDVSSNRRGQMLQVLDLLDRPYPLLHEAPCRASIAVEAGRCDKVTADPGKLVFFLDGWRERWR